MHSLNDSHQVFDTVVFGSGLSGLSCARRLAVRGQKVVVLEKANELGGHLLPFERAGATFEVGLHYIADTGQGTQFALSLEKLSLNLEQIVLDDEFETLIFQTENKNSKDKREDFQFAYCKPVSNFVEKLKREFPVEQKSIEKYFTYMEVAWSVAQQLKFPIKIRDVVKIFSKHPHKKKILFLLTRTLEQIFSECQVSQQLREILAVHHVLIGVPPSRVSAFLHLTVQRYYFEDPCFVRGGGRAMISSLLHDKVDYRKGIQATFERCVDPMLTRRGIRYQVAVSQDEILLARNVVWTADPRSLSASARGIGFSAFLREKLSRATPPHALIVGYYATKKPLQDYGLKNCNYWLLGKMSAEDCYKSLDPMQLASDSTLYISTGSLRDPLAIREGNTLGAAGVFQAMFLCPPTAEIWGGDDPDAYRVPERKGGYGRAYRQKKEVVLKHLTQRLLQQWPQLESELVWQELGSPLTHRRYLNSLTLNGYGYAPTVSDLLWKRPSAWTNEDGLFLCGAHIRPSHGIVTALVNGVGLADLLTSCEN